jgi:hypothetical protein
MSVDDHIALAAELATLRDAIKTLTVQLDTVFRRISDEAQQRAQLEAAVDDAQAALDRAERHQGARNAHGIDAVLDPRNVQSIAEGRRQVLEASKSQLAAFISQSWASRIQRLEAAKARARQSLEVPLTTSFQGPLMTRVLRQGRRVEARDLAAIRQRAVAAFVAKCTAAVGDANPTDGDTPPADLHRRWCTAVILTQPQSQVAADIAQVTKREAPSSFQATFAAMQAASTAPRVVVSTSSAPMSATTATRGIPADVLLPPAKHIIACRLSARSTDQLRDYLASEMDVLAERILPALLRDATPQTRLTGGRMARRAAVRAVAIEP